MTAVRYLFQKLSACWRASLPLWRPSTFLVSFSSQSSTETSTSIAAGPSHLRFLILSCVRVGSLRSGCCLHARIIKIPPFFNLDNSSTHIIYNSLLHLYCKCSQLQNAIKLFDDMPLRDTVSWNSLISGFLKFGRLKDGFGYFKSLVGCSTCQFDHASLTSMLSACDGMECLGIVRMIHALAILSGYETEVAVNNALTTSYFKCQSFESGMRVFHEMEGRNVVTWTAVISGLAQNEFYVESMNCFLEMWHGVTVHPNCLTYLSVVTACSGLRALKEGAQIHGVIWKLGFQLDMCIESALMDMYVKCGCVDAAWQIFESAEVVDEVSLTVILAGLAQNGFEEEAIKMFAKMVNTGTYIDPNMISAVLGVSGIDTSQSLGVQIHSLVIKKGFSSNVYINNGLINMYSKCGELHESIKVFDSMPWKNQISWNSIIAAYARHGDGLMALHLYNEMQSNGVEPTDVTFLSLLHACSHAGLLYMGMEFLHSMQSKHGLHPRMEHYACMVDMFGRAGLLKEAKEFIEGLPVKPDALIWQALLGACSIYAEIDIGQYAADRLAQAQPGSPVPYIAMANIYSSRGRWRDRATTIKKMKDTGVAKETGISWIEINKRIHSFVVADRMHPRADDVCEIISKLFGQTKDEEYIGDNVNVSFFSA